MPFFFFIKDKTIGSPVLLVTGSALLQSKLVVLSLVSISESVLPSLIFSFWDWLFTACNLSDTQGPIFKNIIASEWVFSK